MATFSSPIQDDLAVNWHPFMQMKDFETRPPIRIVSAKGLRLQGEDHWYYDTISSWWCNLLGHGHPAINEALRQQLDQFGHIMFGNFTHDPAIQLSKRLVSITPSKLTRVYYSDNGSTAIEVACKMALHYWKNKGEPQKNRLVAFDGSYHGDTIGAMSLGGVHQYNGMFGSVMFDAMSLPNPSVNESRALDELHRVLQASSHHIAAVSIEPLLMGAGGMTLTSLDFYYQVRQLTHQYNVSLISDEVATGFGRTGHLFVSTAAGVSPDYLCLSKALTNGQFPLAVTMTTDEVFSAFYDDFEAGKTFYHGHTFTANPLGCCIANATIDSLMAWDWATHVASLHDALRQGMQALVDDYDGLSNLRTVGTVAAIDVDLPGHRALFHLSQRAFDHHLVLRPLGNSVYLFLPLVTTLDECRAILGHLRDLFRECTGWHQS